MENQLEKMMGRLERAEAGLQQIQHYPLQTLQQEGYVQPSEDKYCLTLMLSQPLPQ